jgi:hypothetical protein
VYLIMFPGILYTAFSLSAKTEKKWQVKKNV